MYPNIIYVRQEIQTKHKNNLKQLATALPRPRSRRIISQDFEAVRGSRVRLGPLRTDLLSSPLLPS